MISGLNSTTLIATAITAAINGGTTFVVVRWLTRVEKEITKDNEEKKDKRLELEIDTLKERISKLEKPKKIKKE
jgi:cell division protein FtsB